MNECPLKLARGIFMKLDLMDMLYAISFALEKAEIEIFGVDTGHNRRVACLCMFMAEKMGMEGEDLRDYIGCCILHDNALTEYINEELRRSPAMKESKTQLSDMTGKESAALKSSHSVIGEQNIHLIPFRTNVENIILYHHENADGSGTMGKTAADTGLKSQILHLADSVDMNFRLSTMTKAEFDETSKWVQSQSGKLFSETAVKLFCDGVTYENISYLQNIGAIACLRRKIPAETCDYSNEEIHDIAEMFARIIDYKSEFTQTHSLGVAAKAEQMANYYGFDPEKTTRYYFAGALHDIGKLVVSNNILEKPGRLTENEFATMKDHASATYYILDKMKGISDILEWASNHHEKLNGKGYPRGLTAKELSFEERLMACIDIYQALTEKRPYKDGMSHEKTIAIMRDMADRGELDETIVRDMEVVMARLR